MFIIFLTSYKIIKVFPVFSELFNIKMVSSEEESDPKAGDTVEWDVEMEIQLFYAMANHKPVGINKHFQMACIWEKLSNSITKEISTQDIWKHLETLYDISMLDDAEPIPFPNQEVPFSLPENEFGALIKQKSKDAIVGDECEDARSPSPKVTTPRSTSRGTTSKESTPKAVTVTTTPVAASRKDSISALSTKTRKESGSSHASTDTPSVKSEKDYDRRRDSRDSNASGPRDTSSSKKSTSQREKAKSKVSGVLPWDSPHIEEDSGRRGRRRANTSTPPATTPAKRRRT